MNGIVYIGCTPVVRYIILSHIKNYGINDSIPIKGIINIDVFEGSKKANYDSLADLHLDYNIPLHYCKNVNDKSTLDVLKKWSPKLIIQSGWSQKFSTELLNIPEYGCIGEHPSPIPKGRGAATVNWAIIEGAQQWGDSFFQMVEKYDAGPVYAQKYFKISPTDTCKTVYDKVGYVSSLVIKEHLKDWYNGRFASIELDESKATYCKRRTPKDGEISLEWDGSKIYNHIRALTKPYPGAFIMINNQKVLLWAARIIDNVQSNSSIIKYIKSNHTLVIYSADKMAIEVTSFQLENEPFHKPIMGL